MHSLCAQLRSLLKRHPKVSTHNTIPQLWPSCLGCDLKIFLGAGFAHFDRQDVPGMEKQKNGISHVADIRQRTTTLSRWDQDKYSDWGGMARLGQNW